MDDTPSAARVADNALLVLAVDLTNRAEALKETDPAQALALLEYVERLIGVILILRGNTF